MRDFCVVSAPLTIGLDEWHGALQAIRKKQIRRHVGDLRMLRGLRHDPEQKRLIQVLGLVRHTILARVDSGKLIFDGSPPPGVYLGVIASLVSHRLWTS
jgi:hypothetical protein